MRVTSGVVIVLLGAAVSGRADDVPETLKPLAGKWARPVVKADDRETDVVPRLTVVAEDKTRQLLIGASLDFGGLKEASFTSYDLGLEKGDKKGLLVIEVEKQKVEIEYTLDKETLKITCKQKVPAGKHLKAFDISGEWKRVK